MMDLKDLLNDIKKNRINLWVENNKLRLYSPENNILTSHDIDNLKQNKQEILQFLKQGDYISKSYPLSRGQEALYFIYELSPKSPAYNTGFALRIFSELDTDAIQKALQALTERHAAFRTAFAKQKDGKLIQNVYAYKKVYKEMFKELMRSLLI